MPRFFTEFDAIDVQIAEIAVKFNHCKTSPMPLSSAKLSNFLDLKEVTYFG